jgi:hypothetical protein
MEKNNIHYYSRKFKQSEDFWVLNVSDVHYDSKNCDRKLLKKHFDLAKKRNAFILINGDWLDVMGMKHDPRSIPNDIRPEYMKAGGSYLDLVIQDSYEFLKNYKENIGLITYGNHETNIVRRQQIDPLKYLAALLNDGEETVKLGGYQGAVIFKLCRTKTNYCSKWYYHHGSGGGAKRSKGILNADLLVSQNSWADVITCGHDHQKWHLPFEVKHLNDKAMGWIKKRIDILRTGSYKKKSNAFGWEVEKDFNEPTLGGYWVKYNFVGSDCKLDKTVIEAK